jgi:hypothetical protein
MAQAHLHDANVPPCFEMQNERVVSRQDRSGDNSVLFAAPRLTPVNKLHFAAGEHLSVTVHVTGWMCSPYSVFIQTVRKGGTESDLQQLTSPSPVYEPGRIDREITHYVTFAIDPKKVHPGARAELTGLRIVISQYGSYKELGALEIPVAAVWQASQRTSVAGIPEYECVSDMKLPAVLPQVDQPRCSNSLPQPTGGRALDLNRDGVCEWAVRDAGCDKIYDNRCYRILEEREGSFEPIAQFYNQLTLRESSDEYAGLSSVERGPLSDITRYSEWQDDHYETHMYLHDCSRLP